MKRKVLLVYPEIPTTYWSYRHALAFIGKKAPIPPLGLLTVAALMPRDFECRLADMNTGPLSDEDLIEADLVFISAMMVQQQSFEEVVARCRTMGKIVVAGGPYPTSSWEKIRGVDHFVLNEAEITLPVFLKDYGSGRARPVYTAAEKPDITLTPVPRFDLADMRYYSTVPLQFSRGCPFNCEFCDIIEMFGRTPRCKTPEQFLREMQSVYDGGFRGPVFIVDDNFIGNKIRVKALLRGIITWQKSHGYPFTLSTEASINLAQDDELLELMAEAGFLMVFVGIESPVKESLAVAGKKQNLKTGMLESIEKIQRKGIEVTGGFIIGFDADPEDIFDRQTEFIQEAAVPTAMIGLLMALPGTQLYRRLESEGRIVNECGGNNTHVFDLNFTPVLPREMILDGYKKVLSSVYDPANYFKRCASLLERFPRCRGVFPGAVTRRASLVELRALIRSLLRQGFSSYGAHYFRFLARVIMKNPRFFTRAMGMAVEGYHFFRITADILKAARFNDYLEERVDSFRRTVVGSPAGGSVVVSSKKLRAYGRMLKLRAKRRYRHLGRGAREYGREAMERFEGVMDALMGRRVDECDSSSARG